jgi:2,4-dienoyl-CoA reductase-like NADH-dependent reductase (Old Yellow Enzyme family)
MAGLFDPLSLGSLTLPNRVAVSPMCTYSSGCQGLAADFHLVHYGAFALGGAGLVVQEATAVAPEGRISPKDLGIWNDDQIPPLSRIVGFLHAQGSAAGIQLAHAGRKAGTWPPGHGVGTIGPDRWGWPVVGPTALPFSGVHRLPKELDHPAIEGVVAAFVEAARRAVRAGYDAIEIHAAHGYLLHQFLSPLSNRREDGYGGSFEHRVRIVLETVRAVRRVVPPAKALLVRLSATDWADGGWTVDETVRLAGLLKAEGVDLIDVSSGGLVPDAKVEVGPLYQVPFSRRVRREAEVPVGAVGLVPGPVEADALVREEQADLVFLARHFLSDPFWTIHAAEVLGLSGFWPASHLRGAPPGSTARAPFQAPTSTTECRTIDPA